MGFEVGVAIPFGYYHGTSGVTINARIEDESGAVFGAELTLVENAAFVAAGVPGYYESAFTPDAVGRWTALIYFSTIRYGQSFYDIKTPISESAGPFSYLDAGAEQDVYEDATTTRRKITISVSNRNMTLVGTWRLYRKVDGANYDLWVSQAAAIAAGSERAWDKTFIMNQEFKITYEESADEGAARAIPYNVITEAME